MSKTILKADLVPTRVLEYVPPKFELGTPEQTAVYFDQRKNAGSHFRMNEAVRIQTGVDEIENQNTEEAIDRKVIERLKEVQETAYQEAYQLGHADGQKKAMEEASADILNRLELFDQVIIKMVNLKKEMMAFNETHLLKMTFQIAQRLAMREINLHEEIVVEVMKAAIDKAQVEEEVVVQVAQEQFEFLEKLKQETGREFEFMKKVKLEPVNGISPGGCIIHTNYGEIDARTEERVATLWESFKESLNTVKPTVGNEE